MTDESMERLEALTPGEIQVAIDHLKMALDSTDSFEERIALGMVIGALDYRRTLRARQIINREAVRTGSHRKRRAVK